MFRNYVALVATALLFVVGAAADNHEEGDAAKGEDAFAQRCMVCHFHDSADRKIGPGLAGIKDGTLPSGKDTSREALMENLNKGGNGMPAFEQLLSEEEKVNIVAYVMSL